MSGLLGMFLNSLDMTSSANDVIVVKHKNGSLHSTPFNVRFGRAKVIRPADKVVHIEVNGRMTKAVMKMGNDGEAFWLEPTTAVGAAGRAESPLGSPTRSPLADPQEDTLPDMNLPDRFSPLAPGAPSPETKVNPTPTVKDAGASEAITRRINTPSGVRTPVARSPLLRHAPPASPGSLGQFPAQRPPLGVSPSSTHQDPGSVLLGQTPPDAHAVSGNGSIASDCQALPPAVLPAQSFAAEMRAEVEDATKMIELVGHSTDEDFSENEALHSGSRHGKRHKTANSSTAGGESSHHHHHHHRAQKSSNNFEELLLSINAAEQEFAEHQQSQGNSPPMGAEQTPPELPFPATQLDAAMNASESTPTIGPVQHQRTLSDGKLTLSRFASVENMAGLLDAGGSGSAPTPMRTADAEEEAEFHAKLEANHQQDGGEDAGVETKEEANDVSVSETSSMYEEESDFDSEEYEETTEDEDEEDDAKRDRDSREDGARLHYRRTLKPIESDLSALNLKDGINTIRYITHTTLRGRVVVEGRIFLWSSTAKLVVSDVDGTVTKSDVLGHILTFIGRDWTHPGICSLYNKVAKNGYQFVYLTARSVSQMEATRGFLMGVRQDGQSLPPGPVITAPDKIWDALTQEVSKKSHEFKIVALKNIAAAFPSSAKPFYAGLGNRIGDVIAYTACGIPKHKIFIIDPHSVVHVCHVKQTYNNLSHLVDQTFIPRPNEAYETGSWEAVPSETALGTGANNPLAEQHAREKEASGATESQASPCAVDGSSGGRSLPGSPSPSGLGGASPNTVSAADTTANNFLATTGEDNNSVRDSSPVSDGSGGDQNSVTNRSVGKQPQQPSTLNNSIDEENEVHVDPDFNSFNYWRTHPEDLLGGAVSNSTSSKNATVTKSATPETGTSGTDGVTTGSFASEGANSFASDATAGTDTSSSAKKEGGGGGSSWMFWKKKPASTSEPAVQMSVPPD